MMDPREIIDQLLNGELESFTSQEPHDVLVVCEQALGEGQGPVRGHRSFAFESRCSICKLAHRYGGGESLSIL